MDRVAVLTAGGDTPALNATLHGIATEANRQDVDLIGLIGGFQALFLDDVPHIELNPARTIIPELDPTRGGSIIGCSRHYVSDEQPRQLDDALARISRLDIDGLICVGGDGTLNGLQSLAAAVPCVLSPKTIDNDLGLNEAVDPERWQQLPGSSTGGAYTMIPRAHAAIEPLDLTGIINYVNPGYSTAVFVAAEEISRVRTTAETHRRIAIVEVMGRHSGFIALGSSYGQPDIVLLPESPLDIGLLTDRTLEIYEQQSHVVLVCGEGIVGSGGEQLGDSQQATDPSGNIILDGAAERLKGLLAGAIGDAVFRDIGGHDSADAAIFTRKVGHTQRGGRPIHADRYYAAQLGAHALQMLLGGGSNEVASLQLTADGQLELSSHTAASLRDPSGAIHPRHVDPSFYDPEMLHISAHGAAYLHPIFDSALGADDFEYLRGSLFDRGNPTTPYSSVWSGIKHKTRFLTE